MHKAGLRYLGRLAGALYSLSRSLRPSVRIKGKGAVEDVASEPNAREETLQLLPLLCFSAAAMLYIYIYTMLARENAHTVHTDIRAGLVRSCELL